MREESVNFFEFGVTDVVSTLKTACIARASELETGQQ
jgi:hypothetical protein